MNRAQGLLIGLLLLAGLANCKGSEQPSHTTKVNGLVKQKKELMAKIEAQTTELTGKLSCVEKKGWGGYVYIIEKLELFGSAPTVCSKECLEENLGIFFEAVLAQLSSYLEGVEKSPDDAAFMDVSPEVKIILEVGGGTDARCEFRIGGSSMGSSLMSCLSLVGNFLPLPELIENFKAAVNKNRISDLSKQGDLQIVDESFEMTVYTDLAKLANDVLKVIAVSREIGKLSQ